MSISNSVGQPSRLKYGIYDSDHRPKALKTFDLSSSRHCGDAKHCKGVRVPEIPKYQFDHKFRNQVFTVQNIMRKQKIFINDDPGSASTNFDKEAIKESRNIQD